MKSLIASAIILSAVILSVICAATYSVKALDRLGHAAERVSLEIAEATGIEEVEKQYGKIKPFLSLFVCDSEAREAEGYIEDIKSASLSSDKEALLTAKSRLVLHIEQLRRLAGFSIEAIF